MILRASSWRSSRAQGVLERGEELTALVAAVRAGKRSR